MELDKKKLSQQVIISVHLLKTGNITKRLFKYKSLFSILILIYSNCCSLFRF